MDAASDESDHVSVGRTVSDNDATQGATQASVPGASATDQVVDVRLSSELQQALLQAKGAKAKSVHKFRGGSHARTAPNVEDEVAKERQMDVYIHDGFGEAEKVDAKYVKEVNANKNLKP